MNKVYVVYVEQGEYSDYRMTNICAFNNAEDAKGFCDIKNQRNTRIQKAKNDAYSYMNKEWEMEHRRPDYKDKEVFKEWNKLYNHAHACFLENYDGLTVEDKEYMNGEGKWESYNEYSFQELEVS